ncbi:hypothetical protein KKHLCK_04465 [Candidatus Electrothrix laxa]
MHFFNDPLFIRHATYVFNAPNNSLQKGSLENKSSSVMIIFRANKKNSVQSIVYPHSIVTVMDRVEPLAF